ncbi:MAG: hypothetical protein II956_03015 [Bacteroidales bacterium]|nr:hypothetical protein [Bacteroidales bacterium]
MKKIFALLAAAFITLSAAGQDDMPDFSGFESDMIKPASDNGVHFCGGVTYDLGFIGENAALGCTGVVGANFYNKLRVGGYFNGMLGISDYSSRYYDDLYNVYGGIGGFVSPRLLPDKKVSINIPVKVGCGFISLDGIDSYGNRNEEIDSKTVFAVTPGVMMEINFCRFFSMLVGVNFMITSDATLYNDYGDETLDKNGLNRIMFSIGGIFGKH